MPQQLKSKNVVAFDNWVRGEFRELNSELEDLYFSRENKVEVDGIGGDLKAALLDQGNQLIRPLLNEGNTDDGFDQAFDLLGNVGFFMAACRRHGLTDPAKETRSPLIDASALAMQIGASLGVIPRFASSHLETHNRAIDGRYHTFTNLPDEKIFLDFNTRAVFAYTRAADALFKLLPLGLSHPIALDLLEVAKNALDKVVVSNNTLFEMLDTDRFFYSVRPYYKPHTVGIREYRGANAGDFAGINVIDLLLGLCKADDPYYSQILVDKFLYMRPEDQLLLRDCMRRRSIMDGFLAYLDKGEEGKEWYQRSLKLFLEVCDSHGKAALAHHEQLVHKFIEIPAAKADLNDQQDLTASGPPLPVLLKSLRKLCDLRCGAYSDEFGTRFDDLQRLKASVS